MKIFDSLFESIIKHEGYYANVTGDRGAETYMGISRMMHPNWKGWNIIDDFKNSRGVIRHNERIDIPELTESVKEFYKDNFYYGFSIDKIKNNLIQEIIFDWCVNSGRNGIKGLQGVLKKDFSFNIEVDGYLGEETITASNTSESKVLFDAIKIARVRYYNVISKYGENYRFLKGWVNRIESIKWEK